ncbi:MULTISPECIES: SpoIIIAH-like family protein [Paenibacillus]|uniref:SpoIIIAH-like family protein n=1 Tax=Paenibacillus TaxID=44249 RepID=UPI00203A5E1C|nr:SpoIIIAH-like family protein [Paenibacillus camelliae]MCM3633172.1 SpoIIIAH-like family protein [Paenibacillus camelliae]
MNTKRQTIWLVSMLSLMVILSAYYLFTQDIGSDEKLTDATHMENTAKVNSPLDINSTVASGTEDSGNYTISDVDQDVLSQLEAEGYFNNNSKISELMTKRENQLQEKDNQIMSVLADVSADTDRSLEALEEMAMLEQKMEKITQLESDLKDTYDIAIISQEVNDKYKVVVTSDTLEKKQAAEIIAQVIEELEVRPEQVSVQFIANP